jgi:hypothetical protein
MSLERRRKNVKVRIEWDEAGNAIPQMIFWQDGLLFDVDRILNIEKRASVRAGGYGLCYRVRVTERIHETSGTTSWRSW